MPVSEVHLMATRLASVPSSVMALPFLLARARADDLEWTVRTAMSAAIAAERAMDARPRNTRSRLAYLLCELGFQLTRRGIDPNVLLPIPRVGLAEALGTSLCRVKRTLALLHLSGVIDTDCSTMRVTDWRRLAGLGGYDVARLGLSSLDDEPDFAPADEAPPARSDRTVAGDPACFV